VCVLYRRGRCSSLLLRAHSLFDAQCFQWSYSPQAASWLVDYAAHCRDLVVAVDSRLFVHKDTLQLTWSKFVLGLSPDAQLAAVSWRARNLWPSLLALDDHMEVGLSAGSASRTLRALTLSAPGGQPGKDVAAPSPSLPPRAPAWGASSAVQASRTSAPLRTILRQEEEDRGRAHAASMQAAARPPPSAPQSTAVRPASITSLSTQASPSGGARMGTLTSAGKTPPAAGVRVLQKGQPVSWAQAVVAPRAAEPQAAAAASDVSVAPVQRPPFAEARKSPMDTTGRVRCLSCGRLFKAYAHLQDHVDASHYGVNSADPAAVAAAKASGARASGQPSHGNAKRAPLMLADLMVRALFITHSLSSEQFWRACERACVRACNAGGNDDGSKHTIKRNRYCRRRVHSPAPCASRDPEAPRRCAAASRLLPGGSCHPAAAVGL
jgi:hypothetical protein